LEELGFDKCYHFSDMSDNLEHPSVWLSLSRGEKINWERLFEGYQSTVYWSPSCDYLEILKQYPDAKALLTVRDPEKWYKSMHDTIYKFNRLTFIRKVFLLTTSLFRPEVKKTVRHVGITGKDPVAEYFQRKISRIKNMPSKCLSNISKMLKAKCLLTVCWFLT